MNNRKNPKLKVKELSKKDFDAAKQRQAVARLEANRRSKGDRIDKCYFEGINGWTDYRSDRINTNHPIGIKYTTKKKK
jgi:hypothetical protein|tara:strand:+ start:20656 stop:20889 length:234 start_codon:yes stop_codon:yes gene_type:complete